MSHLKRIGCAPVQQWPLPDRLGADADVVVLPIEEDYRDAIRSWPKASPKLSPPLVGIVECKTRPPCNWCCKAGARA